MSLVRQAHGGRDYDNRFGIRQSGQGAIAEMIGRRFTVACRRAGLKHGRQWQQRLTCSLFEPPGRPQRDFDFDADTGRRPDPR
jgi:hypothetical protein